VLFNSQTKNSVQVRKSFFVQRVITAWNIWTRTNFGSSSSFRQALFNTDLSNFMGCNNVLLSIQVYTCLTQLFYFIYRLLVSGNSEIWMSYENRDFTNLC